MIQQQLVSKSLYYLYLVLLSLPFITIIINVRKWFITTDLMFLNEKASIQLMIPINVKFATGTTFLI